MSTQDEFDMKIKIEQLTKLAKELHTSGIPYVEQASWLTYLEILESAPPYVRELLEDEERPEEVTRTMRLEDYIDWEHQTVKDDAEECLAHQYSALKDTIKKYDPDALSTVVVELERQ